MIQEIKYWNYEDYNGSLENEIADILNEGYIIDSVVILEYCNSFNTNTKQTTNFPIKVMFILHKSI